MTSSNRRNFLRMGASIAAVGALPANLQAALAVAPHRKTGTLQDVEHVVILMQENRSFDHYFGCLRGVRGYGDPHAARLPDGDSVFAQKSAHGKTIMPFRMNTVHTSSACIASLDHSWKQNQTTWNEWDCWVPHKTEMTMGHFTREDIPYYYALAEAFTICDSYHCSIFGPTNPNRLFLFSGTNGLTHGFDGPQAITNIDDGNETADIRLENPHFSPFQWVSYAEDLQKAGVSWQVYQEYDNFGDNPLASFVAFRGVKPGSWQYERGRRIVDGSNAQNAETSEGRFLLEAFERDVAKGTLPQVSWIVPSQALSEHPDAPPGFGEHLISRLMDVFSRHPEVWSKTVFILNYDENDGFYDHVPAPVPALTKAEGISTVSMAGESYRGVSVGLGPRVPAMVISPWSKGGRVNSELFDHTSVLRFLEKRFGVPARNITPWRRSVCGDLTSALDFSAHDSAWAKNLPNTDDYMPQTRHSCTFPHPEVPETPMMPKQEAGQRVACALPYRLTADVVLWEGREAVRVQNHGQVGAVFRLSGQGPARAYTVGAGHEVDIDLVLGQPFHVAGPNGFVRERAGAHGATLQVALREEHDAVVLSVQTTSADMTSAVIEDAYGVMPSQRIAVERGRVTTHRVSVARSSGWYALAIDDGRGGVLRFCGHVENGRASLSDPLIARR
ncbi:phosphocholine-specific phospholipase C [Neokomagataea anthophila]|uniref:phospholipase C n=1 Tax=Neokomagataea anthophila TaxID=2826925 RepID=A0ABS5E8Z9_9PROT|nr:phospholipase C, phosphocholine-specific [Neokomagataea anthophila]MBR0560383.1 phospholipase C, phosphocholine-specific [Neokomagataea anthophila]